MLIDPLLSWNHELSQGKDAIDDWASLMGDVVLEIRTSGCIASTIYINYGSTM